DLVGAWGGYIVDQTRTLAIGVLPEGPARTYRAAIEMEALLAAAMRPGVLTGDLFRQAQQLAADYGLADHFLGYGGNRAAFCGHGLGLELDEFPVIAKEGAVPLATGMVLALEPKFSFPGLGVIGVEDTYLVTAAGAERLTGADYSVGADP
ncbi:MAG TPA: M24 family metallopeptidase, partial [Syntrophales bacterium]|nr:M24 family metallopeptidase [Syntrophales bacterium]